MILLDTHALIWWVDGTGEKLSDRARERMDLEIRQVERGQTQAGLLVSAISSWEVGMLVSRGRLALSLEVERWLALVEAIPAVHLLPLEPAVAVAATRLPEPFHPDPADRFLVAQARNLGCPCSMPTARSTPIHTCSASSELLSSPVGLRTSQNQRPRDCLMRARIRRLKEKATEAPKRGSGPGTGSTLEEI